MAWVGAVPRQLSPLGRRLRLGVEGLEVGVGELDRGGGDVLLQVPDLAGAGDRQHYRAAFQHPGQGHLAWRGAGLVHDRVERRAGLGQIAGLQREPRDEADAVGLAVVQHRHAGLSNVTVEEIEAARKAFPVATVQNRYNLVDRSSEAVLNYCEAHGNTFRAASISSTVTLLRPAWRIS